MRFNSKLHEAIFMKRPLPFLAQAYLSDNRQMLLRCPNLRALSHCDVLGSRIWYSSTLFEEYLHTWELVEVDGGALVSVNRERINELVLEGILTRVIGELQMYDRSRMGGYDQSNQWVDIVLQNEDHSCFVNVEQVCYANPTGEGFFPDKDGFGLEKIEQLIQIKKHGQRAVLFFCVTHTGVQSVQGNKAILPIYDHMLKEAVDCGVEILAYKTDISLEHIVLQTKIPVLIETQQVSLK